MHCIDRLTAPRIAWGRRGPAALLASGTGAALMLTAQRLVAANPGLTYGGKVPEVLRHPRQARDTPQLAIKAMRRAAPSGDVSHLHRPWKVTETFLLNHDRKLKPRTLE